METIKKDVIIIGSGFGAAAPALRLSEVGMDTLVLEKGPGIVPGKDLKITQDPKYITKYLKNISSKNLKLTFAEAFGGGSGFYEMISLRTPGFVFNELDQRGNRIWPEGINRTSLDPYYDQAEKMLSVHQIEPERIPKSGLVFSLLMKRQGYRVDRVPYAVKNCVGAGTCITGCVFGAKEALYMNYFPEASRKGLQIETSTEVISLFPLNKENVHRNNGTSNGEYRYLILARKSEGFDQKIYAYETKILILAAGTVGTPKILLQSADKLPYLSKQVGRNITFNGSVKQVGILPDDCPDGDMYTGQSHPGIVSYEFLESHGLMLTAAKALPIQLLANARLSLGNDKGNKFWGKEHLKLMRDFRHRMIILVAFGNSPPSASLSLDRNRKLFLTVNNKRELKKYYRANKDFLLFMIKKLGCEPVKTQYINGKAQPVPEPFFMSAHQMGSCRMAADPESGVVDAHGEVFGYPGMFITDGSIIPSSLIVNPSLTILANAERIAEYISKRFD